MKMDKEINLYRLRLVIRSALPLLAQFAETAEYYSTAFHELTHSTGHASRLDRLSKTAYFGTQE